MATFADVRRIALELPEVEERPDGSTGETTWRTKKGMVVWSRGPRRSDLTQLERLGRTWPEGEVGAVRVTGDDAKQDLLAMHPNALFTIPHFDGYPAVLVRLDLVDEALLRTLIVDGWTTRVSRRVAKAWLEGPA